MERQLSAIDRVLIEANKALRTLVGDAPRPVKPSPSQAERAIQLGDAERHAAAGLMRVNHSGEVCAQALYQGQALTAKLPNTRKDMEAAAAEEADHLSWCEDRIHELGGHTSILNPLWYALSFGLGAGAGLISDRLSLGFVAATEEQVCEHLRGHLDKLPVADVESRWVVEQMLRDEAQHAKVALAAGGTPLPMPVKAVMTLVSKGMTSTSYFL
ncbi:MAG: 2-polyprenyl-3-methyl-6-methoxy-1,4-benzoquinone monooxygenase [Porticoccaceae bacterium]